MSKSLFSDYVIDYIEIYAPMIKPMVYWHTHALGFSSIAVSEKDSGSDNSISYLLVSNDIKLLLTSTHSTRTYPPNREIQSFIDANYCGVKRIALKVTDVKAAFENAIDHHAIPIVFPFRSEDQDGYTEEASVRLFDSSEITFIQRDHYRGVFKPGYKKIAEVAGNQNAHLVAIDHIASEVRINESEYWTNYLTSVIATSLVQSIERSDDNKTGMILNINQSGNKYMTFVIAEPDTYTSVSKVQQNINKFGPGIHHLAFSTNNMIDTVRELSAKGVDFLQFPKAYYDLLRSNSEFEDFDIDELQNSGILIDKEGDSYLLQKFIKPISDRPFFLYELVQRVNGYNGFALKNINVLKKAEEIELIK
jgi:4-hydroxyphenylpyruvate dioxygenase